MAWLTAYYSWIKAFHIIAVIAWMAGLLYLPRLFIYHTDTVAGSAKSETFKIMERRLLKAIMGPAMVVTWGLGLGLLAVPGNIDWTGAYWIYAKLILVVILTGLHMFFAKCVGEFAADRNQRSARFYRFANEIPTVLMIGIVIFVVVRPF